MRKPLPLYRLLSSLLLVGLLMNTYVWKELHHVIGHDHSEHLECEHHGRTVHFHDAYQHGGDCYICQFNIAPLKKSNPSFRVQQPFPAFQAKVSVEAFILTQDRICLPAQRGPPSLC